MHGKLEGVPDRYRRSRTKGKSFERGMCRQRKSEARKGERVSELSMRSQMNTL